MAFSPIAAIDQWHSPVLLVQADDDEVLPSQQAAELIARGRTTAILAAFEESSGSLSWLTVHRTSRSLIELRTGRLSSLSKSWVSEACIPAALSVWRRCHLELAAKLT